MEKPKIGPILLTRRVRLFVSTFLVAVPLLFVNPKFGWASN